MARGRTRSLLVRRHHGEASGRRPEQVVVEEPLEIRLDGRRVAATLRTPGHDYELAVGRCFVDGLLAGAPVRAVRYCATGSALDTAFNVVTVDTGGRAPAPAPVPVASCGWCGADQIDDLALRLAPLPPHRGVGVEVLLGLAGALAAAREPAVDGVHAAAAFDRSGALTLVREDVDPRNAVDQVVGRLVLDGALPAAGFGLVVDGRVGFETVQQAWSAGFTTVVGTGAASSLAIDAATRAGIPLVGSAGPDRLDLWVEAPDAG